MPVDEVIELELPWTPDPGAPLPLLWQNEREAVVVYHPAAITGRDGDRAVLRFPKCMIAQFGYPNDEALGGHPLYARGLRSYGIFEVLNSSWLDRLRRQNLVRFPEATWWPGPSPAIAKLRKRPPGRVAETRRRHFIVTFHDETFECIADSIEGHFSNESLEAIVAGLLAEGAGERTRLA